MNILLIQPGMNKRPMDTDLKTRMSPSLALASLISLTPKQHRVTLVNENIEAVDYSRRYDLVGITVTLDIFPRAVDIARRFREKGVPVVVGGVHITCCPADCLQYFDAVCIGAAERVWARILDDARQNCLQKVYHDMDGFRGEELIQPSRSGYDSSRYLYTNIVSTSRGCPNRCSFCYNSNENRYYTLRPIPDVLADIESLGTRHVLFIDDNFIGDPAYTRQLLESLRGMRLIWSAAVTANIADYPELLTLMRETGCQSLFIGFESINNASLRNVNKDNRYEKYERLIRQIHNHGIMINASMVFGLDGDSADVFKRTLDWLVGHKIETLTAHILTPYPGTELYRRIEREGRIICRDLSKYNTANVVFKPKAMTADELYDGYIWMYRQFYSFRNILRRMPVNKRQRTAYLLFNLLYRKFGRITAAVSQMVPLHALGRLAALLAYRTDSLPTASHDGSINYVKAVE